MAIFKIAIDCMGGDKSPHAQVGGVKAFIKKHHEQGMEYVLYGQHDVISNSPQYDKALFDKKVTIVNCDRNVVQSDDPRAIKNLKGTSMHIAILDLSRDKSDLFISSGNTGALMVLSTIILGRVEGIKRAAIAAFLPTLKKDMIFLDVGGSITCEPRDYTSYLQMGIFLHNAVYGTATQPRCGMLNVGNESVKGSPAIQAANEHVLANKGSECNYIGYIEPNSMLSGECDIVITEGILGNITIKSIEGTATLLKKVILDTLDSVGGFRKMLLYLLLGRGFKSIKGKLDPRSRNGAIILGLKKLVIKSHGNSDEAACMHAIELGYKLHKKDIIEKIALSAKN